MMTACGLWRHEIALRLGFFMTLIKTTTIYLHHMYIESPSLTATFRTEKTAHLFPLKLFTERRSMLHDEAEDVFSAAFRPKRVKYATEWVSKVSKRMRGNFLDCGEEEQEALFAHLNVTALYKCSSTGWKDKGSLLMNFLIESALLFFAHPVATCWSLVIMLIT